MKNIQHNPCVLAELPVTFTPIEFNYRHTPTHERAHTKDNPHGVGETGQYASTSQTPGNHDWNP